MSKKPTIKVFTRLPDGFDIDKGNLPVVNTPDADKPAVRDEPQEDDAADNEDGDGFEIVFTPDGELPEGSDYEDEQDTLFALADEWLPALPEITVALENISHLDFNCLTSARVLAEHLMDKLPPERVDSMCAAFLVMGAEDDYDEMIPLLAEETLQIFDELLTALSERQGRDEMKKLAAAPPTARTMLLASMIADLEITADSLEGGWGEAPERQELAYLSKLIAAATSAGDLDDGLVKTARDNFNALAAASQVDIWLTADNNRISPMRDRPAGPKAPRNKPPKP